MRCPLPAWTNAGPHVLLGLAPFLFWLTAPAAELPQTPASTETPVRTSLPLPPIGKSSPGCVTPESVPEPTRKPICVHAHVYNIVETEDGSSFLDVCPPGSTDEQCRFFVVTYPVDRREVGDLHSLQDRDIFVWGRIMHLHQRLGIYLSHHRQFDGGPEKFRPNPRLLTTFEAESAHPGFHDPNLQTSGRRRTFMNNRNREERSAAVK